MNKTHVIHITKLLRMFTINLWTVYLIRYAVHCIFICLNLEGSIHFINTISSIIFSLLRYIYLVYTNEYSTKKDKEYVPDFKRYLFKNIIFFYTLSFIIHTYIIPKSLLWLIFILSLLPLAIELQIIITIFDLINCIASAISFITILSYVINWCSKLNDIFNNFIFLFWRLITHLSGLYDVKPCILPSDIDAMKDTVRKMGSKVSELTKTERELDWTIKMSGLDFKEAIKGNITDDTKKKAVESVIRINSKWHDIRNDLNRDMVKVEDYKTLNPEFISSTESSAFRSSCTKVRIRFDLSQSNYLRKYSS